MRVYRLNGSMQYFETGNDNIGELKPSEVCNTVMYNIGPIVNAILLTAMRMPNQIAYTLSKNFGHCSYCVTFLVFSMSISFRKTFFTCRRLIATFILVSSLIVFATQYKYMGLVNLSNDYH